MTRRLLSRCRSTFTAARAAVQRQWAAHLADRAAKRWKDGYHFGGWLLMHEKRPPGEVVQFSVGISPFYSPEFNEGVRDAVADWCKARSAEQAGLLEALAKLVSEPGHPGYREKARAAIARAMWEPK